MAKDNEQELGHKVRIIGNKCYRCGHEWRPINTGDKPVVCPKCKSPYWDKPRRKKKKNVKKN